jgi:hypothetical protein
MHEIYVVKFYEEDDDYTVLYNGNVNKVLTTLTSGLSIALNLELSASFVEFDDDRDIYDFLTIKKKECYKNLMNIIWMKFLGPYSEPSAHTIGMYPSLSEIEEILNDHADLKMSLRENFKNGMCIKHLTKKIHKIPKDWSMMMTNDAKNKFVYFIM